VARVLARLVLLLALVALPVPVAWAQTPDPPVALTAASTDCSTASSCVELSAPANGVAIALTPAGGTFQAEFEITYSGGRLWSALDMFAPGSTSAVESATAAGQFRGAAGGLVRVRLSSCTSCSVLVTMTPLSAAPTSGGGGAGGGGAATTDADDASIAVGQTNDNANALTMVYDGSVWRRLTIGTAGTASAQVVTVQGAASMTPLLANPGTAANWGVYAEDSAHASTQAGVQILGVRQDSQVDFGADGDYVPLSINDAGEVRVAFSGAAGGTSLGDDADFADGTTAGTPIGGVAESAAPTTVTEGDFGWAAITLNRALKAALFAPDGTSAFGTAGTAAAPVLTVQGIASMTPLLATVTATNLDVQIGGSDTLTVGTIATSVTPGTSAAHLGKAEDAAHGSGDTMVPILAVRQDTAAALAGTTGDYIPLTTTSVGAVRVDIHSISGSTPAAAICDDPSKVTTFNINLGAGTGNTELVALNGSDLIYVCSFVYTTGGADTPQLIYGTGTACATGETDLMTLNLAAAGDGIVENGGGAVITKAPAGNALCLERTNSVTAMGRLGYVRQP
jgi:hypothetical protein